MKTEDLADLSERLFVSEVVEPSFGSSLPCAACLTHCHQEPADLRVMEIEMLTTLQWLLHPPTTLSFVSLLACLFEASYDVVENITERASQLVNVALYDMEFLKYGASLQAMTALICVMRHLNLPDPQVKRWLQRTNHCGFDYTLSEDADSLVRDCGVRFMDILRRLTIDDSVDDAEVEEAMELQNHDDGDDDARGHQPRVTPAPRSDTPGGAPPTTAHQQGTNGATRSALREPSPNDVTADVDQSFTQAVAKSALYLDDADDASAAL